MPSTVPVAVAVLVVVADNVATLVKVCDWPGVSVKPLAIVPSRLSTMLTFVTVAVPSFLTTYVYVTWMLPLVQIVEGDAVLVMLIRQVRPVTVALAVAVALVLFGSLNVPEAVAMLMVVPLIVVALVKVTLAPGARLVK